MKKMKETKKKNPATGQLFKVLSDEQKVWIPTSGIITHHMFELCGHEAANDLKSNL